MGDFLNISQQFAESIEWNLILKIVLIYIAGLWISMIIWITRDAINRSNNLLFQIFVIILNILLPLFGLVIYLIIRPTKTLLERYYEDLEYRALVENGEEKEVCQKCKIDLSKDYKYCPNCAEKLRQTCLNCHKEFSKKWKNCPYCGVKYGQINQKNKEEKTDKKKSKKTFSTKK